jgi:hypothetical protein
MIKVFAFAFISVILFTINDRSRRHNTQRPAQENAMLNEALKVVEAARQLGLERAGSRTRSTLGKLDLAHAIDGLREAIEAFDHNTSRGLAGPAYNARPDFATPPQMDDRRFTERQAVVDSLGATPDIDATPEPTETIPDQPALESRMPSPKPSLKGMGAAIPASSFAAAREFVDNNPDYNDTILFDGAENAGDFLLQMDAISDTLEYLVAKVGWNPRFAKLAHAYNTARSSMFLDVEMDGTYVRVPAESFATLTTAIADTVADRDMNLTLPVPKPRSPDHELEARHLPRPPAPTSY